MSSLELDDRGLIVTCPCCGQNNRLAYERLNEPPLCAKCHTKLAPPAEPIDIENDVTFEALVATAALPVLVDFWASWCGPCKMIAPEVAKVAAEGAGRWLVAKVNTEALPALGQRYRVNAIPLMVLFKAGREIARQAGAMPAPAIRQFVTPHL
jgi:thioredoxin 2